jgi:hypothetical protein
LPYIPATDGGTWRRISCVSWISYFCDNPTREKEYKKDPNIDMKMSIWVQPLMWFLINIYYPDYIVNGLREPVEVLEYTEKYRIKSDIYTTFVTEQLEITTVKENTIKINEMYTMFKNWYVIENFAGKVPNKQDFAEQIELLGIEKVNNTTFGYIKHKTNTD